MSQAAGTGSGARSIRAWHTGIFHVPRGFHVGGGSFLGGITPVAIPVLCFAIELEDGGFVLVDAGLDGEAPGVRRWLSHILGRLHFDPAWQYGRRLAAAGIDRGALRAVALTHLDLDHTAGLPGLAHLPTYAAADEWACARRPSLRDRLTSRQTPDDFAALARPEPVRFAPDPALPWVEGAAPVPGTGGAVTLVSLPGHTVGHMGVLVRLGGGARVLLCGDACTAQEQVTERRPLGLMSIAFAADLRRAERTLAAMRRWREADRDLRIIPSHDATTGALCAGGPVRLA